MLQSKKQITLLVGPVIHSQKRSNKLLFIYLDHITINSRSNNTVFLELEQTLFFDLSNQINQKIEVLGRLNNVTYSQLGTVSGKCPNFGRDGVQ